MADGSRETTRKQLFIVRARSEENPSQYYYATRDGSFAAFPPGSVPLHLSKLRNKLQTFTTEDEAKTFISKISPDYNFCFVGAEPASPNLQKHFESIRDKTR